MENRLVSRVREGAQIVPNTKKKRIMLGLAHVTGGQAVGQLLNFARNILIARLLGPEQFGIGLTFAVIVTAFEMAADFSWDKFIVQDHEGDRAQTQSTCHLLMILRGAFLALIMVGLSVYLARFFGVPDLSWAYMCLAVVPIFIGFAHTDVKRFHRELRYLPDTMSTFAGDAAAFLIGIGSALILHDFRAMLFAMLARYAVILVASHALSSRSYVVGYSADVARRAWRFGWPLLINGGLLFLATQGDRLLVGNVFGAEMLGIYGVAALVTLLTSSFVMKALAAIALPLLAQSRGDDEGFRVTHRGLGILYSLSALCLSVPFLAFLPGLLPMLFGAEFAPPDGLVAWLVATMALRIFQGWPIMTAIATGSTRTVLFCTLVRASGFVFAGVAILVARDIVSVAIAFAASQFLATVLVFARMNAVHGSFDLSALGPCAISGAAILFAFVGSLSGINEDFAVSVIAATAMLIVSISMMLLLCPQARSLIRDMH